MCKCYHPWLVFFVVLDSCCVVSRFPLPSPTLVSTWKIPGDEDGFNAGINCPVEERKLKIRVSSNALYDC